MIDVAKALGGRYDKDGKWIPNLMATERRRIREAEDRERESKRTYTVTAWCGNCKVRQVIKVPYRTSVEILCCKYCGRSGELVVQDIGKFYKSKKEKS